MFPTLTHTIGVFLGRGNLYDKLSHIAREKSWFPSLVVYYL